MIDNATDDLQAQARPDEPAADAWQKRYPKAIVRDLDGKPEITEADALIAYLQCSAPRSTSRSTTTKPTFAERGDHHVRPTKSWQRSSPVGARIYFALIFLVAARLRALAVASAVFEEGRPHSAEGGLIDGRTAHHRRRQDPAPRPPATSGTASRNSTRRCRAGGCIRSTLHRLGGRLLVSIRHGRCSRLHATACSAGIARSRGGCRISKTAGSARARRTSKLAEGLAGRDREDARTAGLRPRAGRGALRDNCAPCHGAGGQGSQGLSRT